jgi:biopolymer transport protein ExbB
MGGAAYPERGADGALTDSIIGISKAHTTNLAVARASPRRCWRLRSASLPPIPAVMIYNVLARSTAHYRALIGDASELVMNLASRDLDRGKLPRPRPNEGRG